MKTIAGEVTTDAAMAAKIRRKLKYTWQPFLGRFGRLTDIQIAAIPAVMRGQNVVVCSPTASGKTEAVVAPVAERHREEQWPGLAVVYVAPTRALGNDLELRLVSPLSELYLTGVLKHGDQPQLPEREFHWLITTPESLDSLVCRRPQLFRMLRAVIVDEIHLLDATYRGDQMRVLLQRLRRIAAHEAVNVHLLSATLHDPVAVGHRYVERFEVVSATGARPIEAHYLPSHEAVWQLAREKNWRKVLYFCNSRHCVEETTTQLRKLWQPYPVVAHHGSLDRLEREEAEQVMKQNPVAVCTATSTLEIGIDIGDIDVVVLAEPPWSLESLLQRIGRGSRRKGVIQAVGVYRTDDEYHLLHTLFDAATHGYYLPREYQPDLSVIVQQALSILYGMRTGIDAEELVDVLSILGTPDHVRAILNHLEERGYCLNLNGKCYPASDLLDLGDEGKIHSNIPDLGDCMVVDVASGRQVGRIRGSFDRVFALAGQSWRVVSVQGSKVFAARHPLSGPPAAFGMHRNVGRFDSLLPHDLRAERRQQAG